MPARKMISRRGMGRSSPFKKGDKVVLREDVLQRHARSVPASAGYTKEQFAWRDTLRKEEGKVGTVERTFEGSQHTNVQFPDGKLIGIDASELKKADEKKEDETEKQYSKDEEKIAAVSEPPPGWTKTEGATTAPVGYSWYSNGKSRFSGERKIVLVKDKKEEKRD